MTLPPASIPRPVVRGDIVLVPFPYTDLSGSTRRPAVVIAVASFQQDFTLAFITSQNVMNLGFGEIAVLPMHPEYGLTGLSLPSKIRASKLVTLSRNLLTRWLGRIGPLLTGDLDRALVSALGVNVAHHAEEGRQSERQRLAALHESGGDRAVLADLGVTQAHS